MSTMPGPESWRDAGLTEDEIAEPTNLVEETEHADAPEKGEDYHPGTPRPDRDDAAAEADVADQAVLVPDDDEDDAEGI